MFDASKQAIGALFVHLVNVAVSWLLGQSDKITTTNNPCVWYFLNVLFDTTLGVFIMVAFLRAMDRFYRQCKITGMENGYYGQPPSWWIWSKQLMGFLWCLTGTKIIIILLLQIPFLSAAAEWLLQPISDPRTQLLLVRNIPIAQPFTRSLHTSLSLSPTSNAQVMLIFPLIMNVFQFWMVDNFIKFTRKSATHQRRMSSDSASDKSAERPLLDDSAGSEPDDDEEAVNKG